MVDPWLRLQPMGFTLERLLFHDFRNYPEFTLENLGGLTVFIGPNAVGKTNIIEGIQLLSAQRSFRNPRMEELVRFGADQAFIDARAVDDSRTLDLRIVLQEGKKTCFANDKKRRPADLKGLLPSVVFTPDHLNLVKGSSSVRRHELDLLGSQLSKNYLQICKDYEKVLKSKNALLKEEADPLYLESINDALLRCGTMLYCYRSSLFRNLVQKTAAHYKRIASGDEELGGVYVASWSSEEEDAREPELSRDQASEAFERALDKRRKQESSSRRTLVGPHMDGIVFLLDGKDARLFASQGQQRSIVLAYKLAEMDIIQEMLGCMPLLLLDDVMSELDERRRTALLSSITDSHQAFITTTNLSYFDEETLERAQVITLGKAAR